MKEGWGKDLKTWTDIGFPLLVSFGKNRVYFPLFKGLGVL